MFRFAAVTLLAAAALQASDRVPVVIELFTSEGCSSCPPADNFLAELERKQPVDKADVIVLSEHVDYWNQLGWKDPFSASLFSERQQSYAEIMHDDGVYTPEAVIDGQYAAVGSNKPNVLKAIASATRTAKPELSLTVSREGDDVLVHLPEAAKGTRTWVAITEAQVESHVAHGENGGRTLQHVGVVRSLSPAIKGEARIHVDKRWGDDLRVVAFVQDVKSGHIVQAAQQHI